MKAMSKQQLADRAGVSLKTLNRWLQPYRDIMMAKGYNSSMKVLPPHLVKFIVDKFCIDV